VQQWALVLPGDPSSQTMAIVGICIVAHLMHLHTGNVCSHLAYGFVIVCLQLRVGIEAFITVCDSVGFINTRDNSQWCSNDMSQHSVLRQTM